MTTTIPRRKWLSISERNKHALDIIENTQEEKGDAMNYQIQRQITEIKTRFKDPVTKKPAYKNDQEVRDDAVKYFYEELKNQRLI